MSVYCPEDGNLQKIAGQQRTHILHWSQHKNGMWVLASKNVPLGQGLQTL
jgi:hypothetical protein